MNTFNEVQTFLSSQLNINNKKLMMNITVYNTQWFLRSWEIIMTESALVVEKI